MVCMSYDSDTPLQLAIVTIKSKFSAVTDKKYVAISRSAHVEKKFSTMACLHYTHSVSLEHTVLSTPNWLCVRSWSEALLGFGVNILRIAEMGKCCLIHVVYSGPKTVAV